jgi:drug/metabolite transporter (DMT)-like permease
LREPITLTMILGGLVIISGVMVLNSGKRIQPVAR